MGCSQSTSVASDPPAAPAEAARGELRVDTAPAPAQEPAPGAAAKPPKDAALHTTRHASDTHAQLAFARVVYSGKLADAKAHWATNGASLDINATVPSDANDPWVFGHTPLGVACTVMRGADFESDRLPMLRWLVEELSADVSALDAIGYTPLHRVCRRDITAHTEHAAATAAFLLHHGALPNAATFPTHPSADYMQGVTPLISCLIHGLPAVIPELVAAGADVNARDPKGRTPLMYVAIHHTEGTGDATQDTNDLEMVRTLLGRPEDFDWTLTYAALPISEPKTALEMVQTVTRSRPTDSKAATVLELFQAAQRAQVQAETGSPPEATPPPGAASVVAAAPAL